MFLRFLPILLLLALLSCGCETDIVTGEPAAEEETTAPVADPTPGAETAMAQDFLQRVNAVRASGCLCGTTRMPAVPALRLHPQLSSAAQAHSEDQARHGKMQHLGSDGSRVSDRVTRAGFTWRAVGENVAWNYRSVDAAMRAWLESEGHCKNIMGAQFQFLGVGERSFYWTQVFAR